MADINLVVQIPDPDGLIPAYTALNAVDVYFAPRSTGRLLLHFKNTGTVSTVTFDITQTKDGVSYIDPTFTVPATTGDVMVSGLGGVYEIASGLNAGKVKFSQNVATGVTVAALVT